MLNINSGTKTSPSVGECPPQGLKNIFFLQIENKEGGLGFKSLEIFILWITNLKSKPKQQQLTDVKKEPTTTGGGNDIKIDSSASKNETDAIDIATKGNFSTIF